MADQVLRIKDSQGNIHDLAFALQDGVTGLVTIPFNPDSNNVFGSVIALTPNNTQALVTISTTAQYRIKGFIVTGSGDGYFSLTVGGTKIAAGRINAVQKTLPIILGNISVTMGTNVVLQVRNDAEVPCDYEGILLGE